MKRAERMIRQQIDALTLEHIAPKKIEIEQAIKFMYWQGTLSRKKCDILRELLSNKYNDVINYYADRLYEDTEINYIKRLRRNGT